MTDETQSRMTPLRWLAIVTTGLLAGIVAALVMIVLMLGAHPVRHLTAAGGYSRPFRAHAGHPHLLLPSSVVSAATTG